MANSPIDNTPFQPFSRRVFLGSAAAMLGMALAAPGATGRPRCTWVQIHLDSLAWRTPAQWRAALRQALGAAGQWLGPLPAAPGQVTVHMDGAPVPREGYIALTVAGRDVLEVILSPRRPAELAAGMAGGAAVRMPPGDAPAGPLPPSLDAMMRRILSA